MSANPTDEFEDELTPLQRRFALEYIVDLNASQAIKRAGSSAKNLAVAGNEFLTNPNVAAEIARLVKIRNDKVGFDATKLLAILVADIHADTTDLYDGDAIRPMSEWPEPFRRGLITGIKHDTVFVKDEFTGEKVAKTVITEIKISDRTRLKDLAGRHVAVQAFRDNVALSSPSGGPVEIDVKMSAKEAAEAWKRMVERK